jgi:hypothetical protein
MSNEEITSPNNLTPLMLGVISIESTSMICRDYGWLIAKYYAFFEESHLSCSFVSLRVNSLLVLPDGRNMDSSVPSSRRRKLLFDKRGFRVQNIDYKLYQYYAALKWGLSCVQIWYHTGLSTVIAIEKHRYGGRRQNRHFGTHTRDHFSKETRKMGPL